VGRYDFDAVPDRRGTNSLKYDFAAERGMPEGLLPLWVADMDFRIPPEVSRALVRSAEHAIFGYSDSKPGYFAAVRDWFSRDFGYEPEAEWLVKTPGVVFALAMAVRAFTDPGDAVLVQRPVYYPFSGVVDANGRRLVNNPLVYEKDGARAGAGGRYRIDFDDFERKVAGEGVRLFLLCSPHNPVGRVWTREELARMGEICLAHGCVVVADEIHCDFVFPGRRHQVFAAISPEFACNTILCTAPSKTFNLAGLQVANIFIADGGRRRRFLREIDASGYSQLNAMGLVACQSAYEHGAEWLAQLREYLAGNLDLLRDFVRRRLPGVRLVEPEGTYLAWLDFNEALPDPVELDRFIVREAGLWLDAGTIFGPEGGGFERVNFACPRATLEQALDRLGAAWARRGAQGPR
jgi:cystathionine beta-lyase